MDDARALSFTRSGQFYGLRAWPGSRLGDSEIAVSHLLAKRTETAIGEL